MAEAELFRTAFGAAHPPFSVLHIHGPGGIGKSSLLVVLAEIARGSGASVLHIDGHDLLPSPRAFLAALRAVTDVPDDDSPIPSPVGAGRMVVFLDSYERIAALDEWLRVGLLPRLPADTITVIASRDPPAVRWRTDPAWAELLRVVSLRNLGPQESRGFLVAAGIDPSMHDRILAISHGHPLALSLLADLVVRGGRVDADPLTPGLVGMLLRQFVEVVPTALHRRALEVCALARVTDEGLLRAALSVDDAHEVFDWLRSLSFVEPAPDGVFPHDLARDVLEADLRWRDREGYARTFRAVRSHIHARLTSVQGVDQQRALFDEKFLFRYLPGVLSPVDWESWGRYFPEPARSADHSAILKMVRSAEGRESAGIAERWLELQPDGFYVVRRDNGTIRGLLALLELSLSADLGFDPGARAALDYARGRSPLRPGEVVTQTRFVIDQETYQGPSPTLNATPILTIQRYLRTANLAWDFLTLAEPERWDEYFAAADLPRAEGADFVVGGRRYGLFAHDFRRVSVEAWLELVTERALSQDFDARPSSAPTEVLVLSQQEFEDAVRQALRDLQRPDLLARNPLVRTRQVIDAAGADQSPDTALQTLVTDAVVSLQEDPRDDKLFRAVDRTYLHPASTQERAAAALGLPFSTYRRHLTQGVARVISWLWEREVYGGQPH